MAFRCVYFAPRKSAIKAFLNISANPTLATTVKELVYDARLFVPEYTANERYVNLLNGYKFRRKFLSAEALTRMK